MFDIKPCRLAYPWSPDRGICAAKAVQGLDIKGRPIHNGFVALLGDGHVRMKKNDSLVLDIDCRDLVR